MGPTGATSAGTTVSRRWFVCRRPS